MEAITFVANYKTYIEQLEKMARPEYQHIVRKLKKLDPHSIVKPEHYFNSEAEAIGVVFRLFVRQLNPAPIKLTKQEKQFKLSQEIEAAKELLAANGIQSQGLWCVDDIIEKAKEMRIRCSQKDARNILAHIEQDFDAEFGITWAR